MNADQTVETSKPFVFAIPPRVRRFFRSALCVMWNGKHELYRAYSDSRVYQQCVHCDYETKGFTIDRRDRRLHR